MSLASDNEHAYVILVNNDNTMTTTQKTRVMQRSKLVDKMWFLVNPIYNGVDMSDFTVLLEYVLPVSRRYCNEFLILSEEMHNGYLKYILPFDTELTSEAGNIELQLTFAKVSLDADGVPQQLVRKVSSAVVPITPITAWSDIIPDSALTALDQRIIKTDAQIRAIEEMSAMIQSTKADNIRYNSENNELQLLSGDREIGDKVVLAHSGDDIKDGIPAVDINDAVLDVENNTPAVEYNVVVF